MSYSIVTDAVNGQVVNLTKNFDYLFDETGSFEIKLITESILGCIDSIIQRIEVEDEIVIFIPNIFSPNEDGLNDFFGVNLFGNYDTYEMHIYDRWGSKLFYSEDPSESWNGKHRSKNVASAVYTYVIYIKRNGQMHIKNGTIAVLR